MLRRLPSSITVRFALIADAAASGAMGIFLAVGSGHLAPLLGLPADLLLWAGIVLIPFALLVALAGSRRQPSVVAVRAIATVNLAWVVASLGLVILPPTTPSLIGSAFVLVQALAVLLLAGLQIAALGRGASEKAQA